MTRVLAVDLGLNLGYGFFAPNERPMSGSIRLQGSAADFGELTVNVEAALAGLFARFKPDVVGYAEMFIKFKDTVENVGPMFACMLKLEELARRRRLLCVFVNEREARGAMMPKIPKGKDAVKLEARRQCRARGWPVADEHAADALVVANFILELVEPSSAAERTPLFSNAPAFLTRGRIKKGKRNAVG